jgi:hypothetical protein
MKHQNLIDMDDPVHQRVGVIPCLQELGWNGNRKPEVIVDGCNAYFCEVVAISILSCVLLHDLISFIQDVNRVKELWKPDPSSANLSVADLFIRFLKYYSEEFSFADYVVCCRRTTYLTRLEKMWCGKVFYHTFAHHFDVIINVPNKTEDRD